MVAVSGQSETIAEALTHHYRVHDLPPDGGATAHSFRVRIGPLSLRLPNPPARRRAVFYHDVNHIVTGYNTTFSDGEMAIAGFEVGSGCGPFWIAWYINLTLLALGLVVSPRAVYAAFVRGRRSSSIYRLEKDRATVSSMSVAELQSLLELDRKDAHSRPGDLRNFVGWGAIGVGTMIASLLVPLMLLWMVLRPWLR